MNVDHQLDTPLGRNVMLEYATDALQRNLLFWDVLRLRSEEYYRHKAMTVPHVLSFDLEVVLDARDFERPVNFWLARIEPPAGMEIDPLKRPFVVFDPPLVPFDPPEVALAAPSSTNVWYSWGETTCTVKYITTHSAT